MSGRQSEPNYKDAVARIRTITEAYRMHLNNLPELAALDLNGSIGEILGETFVSGTKESIEKAILDEMKEQQVAEPDMRKKFTECICLLNALNTPGTDKQKIDAYRPLLKGYIDEAAKGKGLGVRRNPAWDTFVNALTCIPIVGWLLLGVPRLLSTGSFFKITKGEQMLKESDKILEKESIPRESKTTKRS